jgi:hypothetical protein
MRESRTIHINADDLAALRQGRPLLIEGADGRALIRIEWDGTMRRAPIPRNISPSSPEANDAGGAGTARKCPYCDVVLRSIKSHIYREHPGKSLNPSGPKCRYCPKRFASATGVMRHEVRSHPKEFVSIRTGKKGVIHKKEAANA